jgi:hypothetical protein
MKVRRRKKDQPDGCEIRDLFLVRLFSRTKPPQRKKSGATNLEGESLPSWSIGNPII